MQNAPDRVVALERARWLDQLTAATSEAQKLALDLGLSDAGCAQARELYARLEVVRSEVDSLRFGDWASVRKEIDPIWLENLLDGWLSDPSDPSDPSDSNH